MLPLHYIVMLPSTPTIYSVFWALQDLSPEISILSQNIHCPGFTDLARIIHKIKQVFVGEGFKNPHENSMFIVGAAPCGRPGAHMGAPLQEENILVNKPG